MKFNHFQYLVRKFFGSGLQFRLKLVYSLFVACLVSACVSSESEVKLIFNEHEEFDALPRISTAIGDTVFFVNNQLNSIGRYNHQSGVSYGDVFLSRVLNIDGYYKLVSQIYSKKFNVLSLDSVNMETLSSKIKTINITAYDEELYVLFSFPFATREFMNYEGEVMSAIGWRNHFFVASLSNIMSHSARIDFHFAPRELTDNSWMSTIGGEFFYNGNVFMINWQYELSSLDRADSVAFPIFQVVGDTLTKMNELKLHQNSELDISRYNVHMPNFWNVATDRNMIMLNGKIMLLEGKDLIYSDDHRKLPVRSSNPTLVGDEVCYIDGDIRGVYTGQNDTLSSYVNEEVHNTLPLQELGAMFRAEDHKVLQFVKNQEGYVSLKLIYG